jgi:hypothetical protein
MTDRVSPFLDLLLAHFFAILRCRSKRHGSGERHGGLTFHKPSNAPDPLFSQISVPTVCPNLELLSD